MVIECVGKPFAVEQAIRLADLGASVLLFSVPAPDDTVPLPLFEDVYKRQQLPRGRTGRH